MRESVAQVYQELTEYWGQLVELQPETPAACEGKVGSAAERYWEYTQRCRTDPENVFHPADRDVLRRALRKKDDPKNWVFPGGAWPNVPQHFKGDPRTARVVTVLLNPGLDRHLQSIPSRESDSWGRVLSDCRLTEQAHILASIEHKDFFWWNWFGAHKIRFDQQEADLFKQGVGLEGLTLDDDTTYFELEIIPYQSVKISDAAKRTGGLNTLPSSKLSFRLMEALMRDDKDCVFVIRGAETRRILARAFAQEGLLQDLDRRNRLFTYKNDRTRTLTWPGLAKFDPATGGKL